MAKKGGQVQLQAELNNEDDWDKFLDREGLIIVDVYSEWCGPCSAMTANLKKLKLEVGGDNLHLAMAKSDHISCLERFRDKSEPTWMFISNRKMTNLVFGANAPKLIRIITEELKKEEGIREGLRAREEMELTEMAPLERERFEVKEKIRLKQEAIELEIKANALHDRRLVVAESILEALPLVGLVLVFPKAKDASSAILNEVWDPAGFKVTSTDKVVLEETQLEELLYFTEIKFPELLIKFVGLAQCLIYSIKYKGEQEVDFDDHLLSTIYGPSKCLPGSEDSPAQKLRCIVCFPEDETEDEKVEEVEIDGVWAPPDRLSRATAIKILLPAVASAHIPPEQEPIPPYIAVSFDAFKRSEVMTLIQEYPKEVMRFGFFTDENPNIAKLIAKNVGQFEKKAVETTYGEKMILQLSKKYSDTVLAFAQLGPSYMSPNSVEGARECALFFPNDYDEPETEEVEEVVKKKTGKRKKRAATTAAAAEGASLTSSITEASVASKRIEETREAMGEEVDKPEDEGEGGEEEHEEGELEGDEPEEGEEIDPALEENENNVPKEADKATSPMGEDTPATSIAEVRETSNTEVQSITEPVNLEEVSVKSTTE